MENSSEKTKLAFFGVFFTLIMELFLIFLQSVFIHQTPDAIKVFDYLMYKGTNVICGISCKMLFYPFSSFFL
jgi:hypothetical protein